MKKTILLMLLVFLGWSSNLLFADSITVEQAKTVAENFYSSRVISGDQNLQRKYFILELYLGEKNEEQGSYYIFNVEDKQGFVIISADDDAFPVLAYSFQGSFDIENIAPATKDILELYHQQIGEIQTKHLKADENIKQQWQSLLSSDYSEKGLTGVDPLLVTTWRQGQFYNADCPDDAAGPDGHALVGCVATAMSQIMKYHSYPPQGTGSHSYNHPDYGNLSADFGNSIYNWASMPDDASAYNDALALIGSHCGISVDMDYGPDGSGASTSLVASSLIDYFDYKTSAQWVWRDEYSPTEWDNILIDEINNNRPIEYRGSGPDGGHAFVLDGYQGTSNNHFHFNWGWGGYANGYFYIDNLNPGGYTFNDGQGAVIGIEPNVVSNYPPTVINPISNVSLDEGFSTHTINISNVFNDANGDPLAYTVISSNTSVVGVSLSGTTLTISENTNGSSTVTVTANDGNGGSVDDVFSVSVGAVSCDPPINLTAVDVVQDGQTATLNWEIGAAFDEFRYDDGISTGQLGFTSGTSNSVLGSVHAVGAELIEMSWYLTAENGPHDLVTLYVMGLDANGLPDENNVLFTTDVSNTDEIWNTYTFANTITADGGFFIGVAYEGFVALGTDDGIGSPYEYASNTHYYSFDFPAGEWTAWESSGFEVNGMIRAMGVEGAVNSYDYSMSTVKGSHELEYIAMDNPINTEGKQTRDLSGYNVYRDGTQINGSLVTGTTYEDANASGYHCFKVTAVYNDCGESDFSNEACVEISTSCAPPTNLTAEDIVQDGQTATLNWDAGTVFDEFRYDDGISTGQLGFTSGTSNSVLGSVHAVGAELIEMSWYLTAENGPHDLVTLYVMGLDANGLPDENNVLFTTDVSNTDEIWNTYTFANTITADGGFFIGVAYEGFVALGTDDGIGSPYEYASNTHYYSFDFPAGEWTAWESSGFEVNGMIRAMGVEGAVNSYDYSMSTVKGSHELEYIAMDNPINTEGKQTRDLSGYNVYRDGTQINGSLVTGTTYEDANATGYHCFKVTAVYSDCGESDFSNEACVTVENNSSPVVINPISDIILDEGFGTYSFDISSVFNGPDGDALSYTVSGSNNAVVIPTVSGNTLFLVESGIGVATITLTASDGNGGSVNDVFTVTVNAVNNPPVVVNPIPDVNLDEGFGTHNVDITNVFNDPNGDDLSYSVNSSNTSVVTTALSGNTLLLTEIGVGVSVITLTADDGNGGSVSDEFIVTVIAAGNNPPVVVNPIPDVELDNGFGTYNIDITNVFNDPDGDVLTYIVSSSNTSVVVPTVSANTLTIVEVSAGSATITLTADDGNGGAVSDVFVVTVNPPANNPPVVVNPIPDVELDNGFGTHSIDIANVFNDPDGDVLTYIVSSSNTSVVVPTVSANTLTIVEVSAGSATITLTADDGNGGAISDVFVVTVNPAPNGSPVVINPISDVDLEEGFSSYNIPIANVFNDPDGDVLSYSAVSDNISVTVPTISGNTLILLETGTGNATITLTANDGNGGTVNDVFDVFVDEVNSINELSQDGINIYPNPSTGLVHISMENYKKHIDISVYNALGKLVIEKTDVNSEGLTVDLSNNERGVYFIKIATDYNSFVKRVVIE